MQFMKYPDNRNDSFDFVHVLLRNAFVYCVMIIPASKHESEDEIRMLVADEHS